VCVSADPAADVHLRQRAENLATQLALPLALESPGPADADLLLTATSARLELRVLGGDPTIRGGHPVACELTTIDTTSPPGRSLQQPLLKALGIRRGSAYRPTILDATAGYGEDAYLAASMGCSVLAVERHPIMAALLDDGVKRAVAQHPHLASRLKVMHRHSRELLQSIIDESFTPRDAAALGPFDVVYLDPMFPSGRKTAERKAMKVARWLVGGDEDAPDLLALARQVARKRVVVKRPLHAPTLDEHAPDVVHRGKSLRFDVYLTHRA
jgi:16S rRNA (guanine1516-N2)-methyltransferase